MRAMINSQQTRDIDPMLGQRRTSVVDDGPTLYYYWVNVIVSCSLAGASRGSVCKHRRQRRRNFPQLTCQPKPNMATQPPRDHYVCGTDNRDSLPKSLKEMWKQVKKFYRVEEYYIGSTNLRINE